MAAELPLGTRAGLPIEALSPYGRRRARRRERRQAMGRPCPSGWRPPTSSSRCQHPRQARLAQVIEAKRRRRRTTLAANHPEAPVARFGATERGAAQRLWGCEVEAVHDPQAARVWLLGRLDPHTRA